MTKDYKRFTKEYLLLQKKYERFEKSDKNRFNEIWEMNRNEVMTLCDKIKDCDRVIHVQQLGIPWAPPKDAIFKMQDSATAGQSVMAGQNTSVMDSSKHGMSKSEIVDDGQMSNSTAKNDGMDQQENFYKLKNVFAILIEEASYLIDDKAFQMSEGKPEKERNLMLIDSCRKSLGIESMEDVWMLVDTFYEFGGKKKKRLAEAEEKRVAEREDQQSANNMPVANAKDKKDQKGKDGDKKPEETRLDDEDDEERDPTMPDIDLDDVVECLEEFHQKREEKLNNQDLMVNPALKKKSNFQTEEQKQER